MLRIIIAQIFKFRLYRAIKMAKKLHRITGYNYMVLNWGGVPKCVSRRDLKDNIKYGMFKKGTTIEYFDRASLYSTHPIV